MDNLVLIKRDKPAFQVIVVGFFVQFFGIILISSSELLWWKMLTGMILLIIGLAIIALRSELYFDCCNNSLIVKWKSLSFSKSQIEKLPEIDHLAIVRIKTTKNLNYKSITIQESGFMCNLNLVYKEPKERFRKLCTVENKEAFQLAKELSEKMDKPILDNSTPDKKWINK